MSSNLLTGQFSAPPEPAPPEPVPPDNGMIYMASDVVVTVVAESIAIDFTATPEIDITVLRQT